MTELIQATIDRINETKEWDELQVIVEELLPNLDLDEDIFQAIEKRQDELYVPTEKEIAQRKLREGLSKPFSMKQSKINDVLWATYTNA